MSGWGHTQDQPVILASVSGGGHGSWAHGAPPVGPFPSSSGPRSPLRGSVVATLATGSTLDHRSADREPPGRMDLPIGGARRRYLDMEGAPSRLGSVKAPTGTDLGKVSTQDAPNCQLLRKELTLVRGLCVLTT